MGWSGQMNNRSDENQQMISRQLRRRKIETPSVLNAFTKIQRHHFVPEEFQDEAYGDFPLSIGAGQTISQPFIIALMMQTLALEKTDEVLEIGTGSGYSTALLASIVHWVDSLEFYQNLLDAAQKRLEHLNLTNYKLWHWNGWTGPPIEKQYDAIIVWASPNRIPEPLVKSLKNNGRMIMPIGKNDQKLMLIKNGKNGITQQFIDWVRFVPLIDGEPL